MRQLMFLVISATPDFGASLMGPLVFLAITVAIAVFVPLCVSWVICWKKQISGFVHGMVISLLSGFLSCCCSCGIGVNEDRYWIPIIGVLAAFAASMYFLRVSRDND